MLAACTTPSTESTTSRSSVRPSSSSPLASFGLRFSTAAPFEATLAGSMGGGSTRPLHAVDTNSRHSSRSGICCCRSVASSVAAAASLRGSRVRGTSSPWGPPSCASHNARTSERDSGLPLSSTGWFMMLMQKRHIVGSSRPRMRWQSSNGTGLKTKKSESSRDWGRGKCVNCCMCVCVCVSE